MSFKVIETDHTGYQIFNCILETLRDYFCTDKVLCISFDNASNNDVAVCLLSQNLKPPLNSAFFHVRCMCHILNLCVQKGLEVLQNEILPIRNSLMYLKSRSTVFREFKRFYFENQKEFSWKQFKLDCLTH